MKMPWVRPQNVRRMTEAELRDRDEGKPLPVPPPPVQFEVAFEGPPHADGCPDFVYLRNETTGQVVAFQRWSVMEVQNGRDVMYQLGAPRWEEPEFDHLGRRILERDEHGPVVVSKARKKLVDNGIPGTGESGA